MEIKLHIDLGTAPPSLEEAEKVRKPKSKPLEDQVREIIELINSDHESHEEWLLLNNLQADLKAMKPHTARIQNLIDLIKPTLARFGMHDVESREGA